MADSEMERSSGFSTRFALVVGLLLPAAIYAALIYYRPAQFRFVVEDAAGRGWPLAWALIALLGYFALVLWALRAEGHLRPTFAALAAVPMLAALAAFLAAGGMTVPTVAIAVAGLACAAAALWLARRPRLLDGGHPVLSSVWLPLVIALLVYVAFAVITFVDAIAIPRAVGSPFILAVFTGTLGVVLCVMVLRPTVGIATFVLVTGALLVFEPNNHSVPNVAARSSPQALEDALGTWLAHRRDLDAYRSRNLPYPVIIVSSEGGGIYAAAHAYGTLSTIARNCPTFSQHVFATVGVSGGAVGNVLYAGAIDPEQKDFAPCRPTPGTVAAAPILSDHLSPVLARLLLLEPLDRLLPGRWTGRDRAQVLTDSFLASAPDPQLAQAAITDGLDPRSARPAVISVAADVATGRRLVMAPFAPDVFSQTGDWWPDPDALAETGRADHQVSLIDAAGLSARFPWITPTGRLLLAPGEERVLADGGYF